LLASVGPEAMYPPPWQVIMPGFGTRTTCSAKNADGWYLTCLK
jgi:hypothetical protein